MKPPALTSEPAAPPVAQPGVKPPALPPAPPAGQARRPQDAPPRCDSRISIRNETRTTIYEIYMRPAGRGTGWGEDLLGQRVLAPGEALPLEPAPGSYDVLMIPVDGSPAVAWREDVCAINSITMLADGTLRVD
ncbi:hypothetical protein M0638_07925 [Roseomonas sp. NAR14]|uniref:Uncharacterized protein n=1 Tax=Roseomonas acroporae TaxID=2937791 RepID=A0A9X2BVT0_9PROT|nr:hypothetical protein [Roseomonas acroporae]MCK8784304.1 hypothetical protein [Roseomonas acroporae]